MKFTNRINPADIKVVEKRHNDAIIFYAPKGLLLSVQSKRIIDLCERIEHGEHFNSSSVAYQTLVETIQQGPKAVCRKRTKGFREIVLNLSGHCNLRCPYCFARHDDSFRFGDFTSHQAFDVIDFCLSQNPKFDEYTIFFFGGEPLMNFKVMEDVVNYVRYKYSSVKFRYGVTTNGTIVNDEVMQFLKKHKITTLLSFDGLDNNRPFANGQSSTALVLENIRRLISHNVPLVIRATLLTTSNRLFDNLMYLESIGVNFEFAFAFGTSSEDTNLSDYTNEARENVKTQLNQIVQYYGNALCTNQTVHCLTILEALTEIHFKIQTRYACAAGTSVFTFNNNGDIYSCQNNASGNELKCGNIHTGISEWNRRQSTAPNVSRIEGCSLCWCRYLCAGGCLSEKIMTGLKRTQNKTEQCDFERMKWSAYLKLASIVSDKNPQYFDDLYNKLHNHISIK